MEGKHHVILYFRAMCTQMVLCHMGFKHLRNLSATELRMFLWLLYDFDTYKSIVLTTAISTMYWYRKQKFQIFSQLFWLKNWNPKVMCSIKFKNVQAKKTREIKQINFTKKNFFLREIEIPFIASYITPINYNFNFKKKKFPWNWKE